MRKEFLSLNKIEGPLIILSKVEDVAYGEIIDMVDGKHHRKGKVVKLIMIKSCTDFRRNNRVIHSQYFDKVWELLCIPLSKDILGRTLMAWKSLILNFPISVNVTI